MISTSLERLGDSEKPSQPIRAKKWVIIRSCGTTDSTSPITSIQSYYTLKPEVIHEEYNVLWCKSMLEDVLVPILDVGTTKGHKSSRMCSLNRETRCQSGRRASVRSRLEVPGNIETCILK